MCVSLCVGKYLSRCYLSSSHTFPLWSFRITSVSDHFHTWVATPGVDASEETFLVGKKF